MFEFDTVSSSSAIDLARALTQRSADGWEVVSIVGSGIEMTAFLRREGGPNTAVPTGDAARPYTTPAAAEPAGWGTAPGYDSGWASSGSTTTAEPTPSSYGTSSYGSTTAASATPASTVPQVPAGWYADPAGRYELRYWDGTQWTEHVARGGTQYTDPPVA